VFVDPLAPLLGGRGAGYVTFWHDVGPPAWIPPVVLQTGLLGILILFCVDAIEKELQLRRLTKLLVDERVLTAALTNRLREVSTLFEAGKAMNLLLDLEEALGTILECANELLDTHDASIMLVHGDGELRTVSVSRSSGARGAHLKFGEGVAGQVAQTREPVLVTGVLDPNKAIVRLGRGLNIEVIAEGIEHQAQADALAAVQCPYGQGWHLSVDLPAEGLAEFLRRS
jgi:hypothetical protein